MGSILGWRKVVLCFFITNFLTAFRILVIYAVIYVKECDGNNARAIKIEDRHQTTLSLVEAPSPLLFIWYGTLRMRVRLTLLQFSGVGMGKSSNYPSHSGWRGREFNG